MKRTNLRTWLIIVLPPLFMGGCTGLAIYSESRIKNSPNQFMMKAIEENNIDEVRYWLDHGVSPNAIGTYDTHSGLTFWYWRYVQPSDRLNDTALENALGHPKILKLLLERGADPYLSDARALHFALSSGYLQSIHILLPYLKPEVPQSIPIIEKSNSTLVAYFISIIKNHENIDKPDKNGNTLLSTVLDAENSSENADYLLSLGANVDYRNKLQMDETLLIKYVIALRPNAVRWLIENHASVNLRDKKGHTALYHARAFKTDNSLYQSMTEDIVRYLKEAGATE